MTDASGVFSRVLCSWRRVEQREEAEGLWRRREGEEINPRAMDWWFYRRGGSGSWLPSWPCMLLLQFYCEGEGVHEVEEKEGEERMTGGVSGVIGWPWGKFYQGGDRWAAGLG